MRPHVLHKYFSRDRPQEFTLALCIFASGMSAVPNIILMLTNLCALPRAKGA